MAHPERELQTKINQWVREHVPHPHMFFAVDRAQATGKFTYARQKSAGQIRGTPDTVLLYPDLPAITVELKAAGKKPDTGGAQEQVGAAIQAAGHCWGWCNSVIGYRALLLAFGVPLDLNSEVRALHHDVTLASAVIRREEDKTGVVSKKRSRSRKAAPRYEWGKSVVKRATKAGVSV